MLSNRRSFIANFVSIAASTGIGLLASPKTFGQTHALGRSLHIGLNRVDPSQYAGWDGTLHGCLNDARDMAQIARAQGFETQILLDQDATRPALLSKINGMASSAKEGDIVLITFSGHGSMFPDPSDPPIKPSHMSDTWCLYDGQLIDHQLHAAWSNFRDGVRILLMSDSCTSGTVAKAAAPLVFDRGPTSREPLSTSGTPSSRSRDVS